MLECFRLVLSSAAFVGATAQEDESEGEKDQDGEIEGRGGVDGAASLGCGVLLFGREGVLCDDVGWKGFCGGCDIGERFGWKGFCGRFVGVGFVGVGFVGVGFVGVGVGNAFVGC